MTGKRQFGEFGGEWREVRLEEVSDILFSNVDKKIDPEEISVRLCNYMDVYSNFYIANDLPFMNGSAKEREIEKYSLCQGDVIITKDSETPEDIANAAVVIEPLENTVCGYHLAVIRPKKGAVDGIFLMHYLHHPMVNNQFAKLANGVTRFGLTTDAVKHAKVTLPPIEEQRRIAEILSTWDEAITLTERLMAAKQRRKKALMQQLLTGKRRFGEFVQSEEKQQTKFGELPVDWELIQIKDIAKINAENLNESTNPNKPYFYIDLSMVNKGSISLPQKQQIFRDLPSRARRVLYKDDVIMATVRPYLLGFAVCDFDPKNILCSTGFALISPIIRSDSYFIYQSLYSAVISRQLQSLLVGSNYPAINAIDVRELKLFWPKLIEERVKIAAVLQACDEEIDLLAQKLAVLQRQKKALMQQLLTGKVRVLQKPSGLTKP